MVSLTDYYRLRKKVDDTIAALVARHEASLACKAGCDDCCQHKLSFLPVEIAAMKYEISAWSYEKKDTLRLHLQRYSENGAESPCPILADGRCLAYEARPLICRTHGLILDISEPGEARNPVRSCRLNYVDEKLDNLPENETIRQHTLTTILLQVNGLFCRAENSLPGKRQTLTCLLDVL